MAQLPKQLTWPQASNQWPAILNPVIANQLVQGQFIQNYQIISGINTINHKLGRQQQGWFIVDQDASATFYRTQPFNDTALVLHSSNACNVSVWMF